MLRSKRKAGEYSFPLCTCFGRKIYDFHWQRRRPQKRRIHKNVLIPWFKIQPESNQARPLLLKRMKDLAGLNSSPRNMVLRRGILHLFSTKYPKNCHFCNNARLKSESLPKPFSAIPSPRKLPIFGHLHLFSRLGPYSFEKLYDAYEELHGIYGPILRLDLGLPLVILFRPEDVQKLFLVEGPFPKRPLFEALRKHRLKHGRFTSAGLVGENGVEWQRLRKATNFMMKPQFSQGYLPEQVKVADDFVQRIRTIRNSEGVVKDFLQELYRFTEEAIGLVCFGTRLGLFDDNCERSQQLTKAADDTLSAMADTLLGFPWWKLFNSPTYRKLARSQEFLQNFASDCLMVANRLLQEGSRKRDEPTLRFLKMLTENPNLSESDIFLLMTEIFSAGIDATGNAIGFTLYNLTKRPDAQEKIFEEIIEKVPFGETISSNVLNGQLPYLRMCLKESHRLTPTAGGTARILNSPTVLSGYEVPGNVLCIGINPTISKQEEHFKDPLSFLPERWETKSQDEKKAHPYCVMPFSHGVRRCIGQRFAEQEMKLCLIKIVQNFRLEYDGPAIGSKMRMLLTPDRPLNLKFLDR